MKSYLQIYPEKVEKEIILFIKQQVKMANALGVVVGMSGGLDSSLTGALCAKALGGRNVLGLTLPDETTRFEDIMDAKEVAKSFGIEHRIINIASIVKKVFKTIPLYDPLDRVSSGNLRVRIRMVILYYYANLLKRLVVGTGNKSEFLIGYFTKYGDGAADIFPLRCLYKTQVRQLAKYMGIPDRIINKRPSAGLWPEQYDEDEIGVTYDKLDLILYGLEQNMSADEIARTFHLSKNLIDKVIKLQKRTQHKRVMPPILKLK